MSFAEDNAEPQKVRATAKICYLENLIAPFLPMRSMIPQKTKVTKRTRLTKASKKGVLLYLIDFQLLLNFLPLA